MKLLRKRIITRIREEVSNVFVEQVWETVKRQVRERIYLNVVERSIQKHIK